MAFTRFSPARAGNLQQSQTNERLSSSLDALTPAANYSVTTEANVRVAAGAVQRCSPRAGGMNVVIPTAVASNFNQTVTLIVENALGAFRVRAASGTINGASAYTLAAGYTTLLILRSNGDGKWVSERASGFPIAGDSLSYSGETLNYVGTNSQIVLTGITGNQGTVSLAGLAAGGSLFISAPTGDWSIEGFDGVPNEGFWFNLLAGSSTFCGTLVHEAAAAASSARLRMMGGIAVSSLDMNAVIYYNPAGTSIARWSVTCDAGVNAVQRTTTGGLITDFALRPNTRTLQIDSGNTAWSIDSIAGGYAGRKLTIENASNIASTGTLVTGGSSVGTAGNLITTPGNINRGGYPRYSAELEYDGVDSAWRIIADTGPTENANQILEIRYNQAADASISETPPTDATWFEVEGCGGGGGGGGADADAIKESCAGGGGGAGAWFRQRIAIVSGAITGAIGAAGTAGANTGGTGGTGGTTTCTYNGVSFTGPGGVGGVGVSAGPNANAQLSFSLGGLGGTADATCTERSNGGDGSPGFMFTVSANPNSACGGNGGASCKGGGGRGGQTNVDNGTAAGTAGVAPGSGGGGGARTASGGGADTGVAGGAGAPGYMKITFYSGPVPVEATIN